VKRGNLCLVLCDIDKCNIDVAKEILLLCVVMYINIINDYYWWLKREGDIIV